MMYFNFLFAMVMGAAISIYLPMISHSARLLGSPAMGNVPFFAIAFVTSIIIALATGARGADFARIPTIPAWLFLSGVVSALMILGSSYVIPRIGTGAFFVLLVAGQILMGLIINKFGLLGVPVQPVTAMKLFGVAMVIAGAAIVTFSTGARA